jgi:hypothetical protein
MSGYSIGQDARIPSLHCHPFFFLDVLHVRQKGLVGMMTITESVAASSPSTPWPLTFQSLSFIPQKLHEVGEDLHMTTAHPPTRSQEKGSARTFRYKNSGLATGSWCLGGG